jgi:hypothetical protein
MSGLRKSALPLGISLLALLLFSVPATAAVPADGKASQKAEDSAAPPDCECGHMHGGHMHGDHAMPPMMKGMKQHMEDVKKNVSALRVHEKRMEGITDPSEFRKEALEHFRMIDGLLESHVKHMESMTGGMGRGQWHHGHCEDCPHR